MAAKTMAAGTMAAGTMAAGAEPLALYVHWPFCLSKCPYCDFNSHVCETVDQARWCAALTRELRHYGAETHRRPLGSIFFGGGTPSLMAPQTIDAVIRAAADLWTVDDDAEITLEANPNSAEAARFRDFRAAGINRLSLGVQSLDDAALAFLGRGHDAGEAIEAVSLAQRIFPRYSFDLIYARPAQTASEWRQELQAALVHAGDHLSVYQLTVEKGTPFHGAWRRGELALPDEGTGAALYQETQDILARAGLPAYEISNHAAAGGECRHNLTYWLGGDYVGIGPGAHGRLGRRAVATEQIRAPEDWLAAVERDGHGTRRRATIAPDERLSETLIMGLRLTGGIPRRVFRQVLGTDPESALDSLRLERLVEGGFLTLDGDGLRATEAGLRRLDAVLAALIA